MIDFSPCVVATRKTQSYKCGYYSVESRPKHHSANPADVIVVDKKNGSHLINNLLISAACFHPSTDPRIVSKVKKFVGKFDNLSMIGRSVLDIMYTEKYHGGTQCAL